MTFTQVVGVVATFEDGGVGGVALLDFLVVGGVIGHDGAADVDEE